MNILKKEPVLIATGLGILAQAGEAINLVSAGQISAIHAGGFGAAIAIVQVVIAFVVRANVFSPHTVEQMKTATREVSDTLDKAEPALPAAPTPVAVPIVPTGAQS